MSVSREWGRGANSDVHGTFDGSGDFDANGGWVFG